MRLANRMVLKEVVACNKAKILVDYADIEFELNYPPTLLDDVLDELEFYGYLVKFNEQYFRATAKAYEYLGGKTQ